MLQVGKKKIIRLDAFGFNPKLIKIDVEGYEVYALEGAQATISRNSPIIQIEINKFALESFGFKKDAIDNWLKDAGYKRKEILAAANNDLFEALYTR